MIFYYNKQKFPHVYVEINDHSQQMLASSPTDNMCRALSPLFSDYGPDDRTMAINSETAFLELYGPQSYKRHGLMGKAIIKHLRAGGMCYVRRLVDKDATKANASIDVNITKPCGANKFYILATGTWVNEQPGDGTENEDWVKLPLTTAPKVSYGTRNHAAIKSKTDAELVSVSNAGSTDTYPIYVLIRTGAGNMGNKTVAKVSKVNTLSNNKDNVYQLDLILTSEQKERYRINAVEDSRFETTPLNIGQVLNKDSYQVNCHYTEANMTALKDKMVEALKALIADFEAIMEGLSSHTAAEKAMKAEQAKVKEILTLLEEDDIPVTALATVFGENTRFPIFSDILEDKGTYIDTIKFANGSNGEILKGKFDWNYTVTSRDSEKVYENLVKSFFEGVIEPSILDFNLVPADVIHDVGYPVAIKEAIGTFTSIPKRRDIMATICPTKISSIAELKSFDEGFKMDNYNCLKVVNWADFYDLDEQRTINVPVTYLLIDAIVKFYRDGWHDPILAGRVVSGIVSGTVTPAVNILTDIEDKTYLVNNAWNYVTSTDVGYILDGQKTASTNPDVVSILQEYHNGALIGRVMKKITNTLNKNRHFLQRPDKVKALMALVNKDLEEFRAKAANIEYNAYYKDAFDEAEGLLTDEIKLTLYGSNKSHKLQLDIFRYQFAGQN